MYQEFFSAKVVFALLLAFGSLIWGIRLWRNPSIYDPDSIFYRKVYLWYASWWNRPVDESFHLDDKEVKRIGKMIVGFSLVTIMIGLILPLFLTMKSHY